MSSYHGKLAYGIRKYFPSFSGLEEWGSSAISEAQWQTAARLNYAGKVIKEQEVPLRSVFQFLKEGKTEGGKVFPYVPLSIDTVNFFPDDKPLGEFASLEAGFAAEWDKIKNSNPEMAGETLLFLAKKYLSKVGCSPDMPHISAFEHIKTTTALAECIEQSTDGQLLLVGVGLDNIQGFCYDIVSSKAAKSLKGRSFFLQMLLDTISKEITVHSDIKASMGQIIYARGGKVFLLLPDKALIRNALDDIKTKLNGAIWEAYRTTLYIFLKYESFDRQEADLSKVWKRLQGKIRTDKQQKNQTLLTKDFEKFFSRIPEGFKPSESGSDKQFCRVSGELIVNANRKLNDIETDKAKDPIWVLPSVKFQSDLGEALRESTEYVQWEAKPLQTTLDPIFTGSKTILTVPEEGNWSLRYSQSFKSNFDARFRWKLNNTKFLPTTTNGVGYGFAFYGGNEQALIQNEDGEVRVKFFSELAGVENNEASGEGFTRLGIGRMDVDNLSLLAERAEASFALNATFSAQLDLFLSGYINTVRASRPEFIDFLNIIFSGGDDMLIVGRWDLTLDFIAQLRKDFSTFQGGDFLTKSAGLVLVTQKFPIAKAVQMAGQAEDKAKAYDGKNALCLLGETISWDKEYDFVMYFSEKLREWLEDQDSGISMSLIFKIYRFYEMQQDKRPNWRWLSAYYFQQAEKNNSKSKAIFYALKVFVISGSWSFQVHEEGIQSYKFSDDQTLKLLSLAGRIADFKNRKNKNSKLKS